MDEALDWADVAAVKVIAGAIDDPDWYEQNSTVHALLYDIADALRKIEAQAYKDGLNDGRQERT